MAVKTFDNAKVLYQIDSGSFIGVSTFLSNRLEEPIAKTDHFTWYADSLTQVKGGASLSYFFKKNQLVGGSLIDSNTVYFYFSDKSTVEVYETCDAISYKLAYLKDDTPPHYSGVRNYLNDRSKWYRIAANWYLWAHLDR